jgi:hypothetical protein
MINAPAAQCALDLPEPERGVVQVPALPFMLGKLVMLAEPGILVTPVMLAPFDTSVWLHEPSCQVKDATPAAGARANTSDAPAGVRQEELPDTRRLWSPGRRCDPHPAPPRFRIFVSTPYLLQWITLRHVAPEAEYLTAF